MPTVGNANQNYGSIIQMALHGEATLGSTDATCNHQMSKSIVAVKPILAGTMAARLCAVIQARAPLGYQDKLGFHFGVPIIELEPSSLFGGLFGALPQRPQFCPAASARFAPIPPCRITGIPGLPGRFGCSPAQSVNRWRWMRL